MKFKIKICQANLKRDLRTVSDMNPFVQIQIGANKQVSQTCYGGAKKPKWNQTFYVEATGNEEITITLFDEGTFENQPIARAWVDISKFNEVNKLYVQTIEVLYDKKMAGKLKLEVTNVCEVTKEIQAQKEDLMDTMKQHIAHGIMNSRENKKKQKRTESSPFAQASEVIESSAFQESPTPLNCPESPKPTIWQALSLACNKMKNQPHYFSNYNVSHEKPHPQNYGQPHPQNYGQPQPLNYGQPYHQNYNQQHPQGYNQQFPQSYNQQHPQGYNQQFPQSYNQQHPQGYNQQHPQSYNSHPQYHYLKPNQMENIDTAGKGHRLNGIAPNLIMQRIPHEIIIKKGGNKRGTKF